MQCPRCKQVELNDIDVLNALSRRTRGEDDEPVYVCSPCGVHEAFQDSFGGGAVPMDSWPVPWRDEGGAISTLVESMFEE